MEIYDSNGGLIVNGYGYNPVWSSDGQTLYTAGGAITEGSSAVNGWSVNGGPDFVTEGNAIVVTDVGQHQMWEAQYYHHEKPRTLITSGGLGTKIGRASCRERV